MAWLSRFDRLSPILRLVLKCGRVPAVALVITGVALIGPAAGPGILFTARAGSQVLSKTHPSATATAVRAPTPTTTTEPAPPAPPAATPSAVQPPQSGCDAALAYLRANANPAFTLDCPGNAYGHEAMTCINTAGFCSGSMVIAIADPCPAAYMNEAANSWILYGIRPGPIDPYGSC